MALTTAVNFDEISRCCVAADSVVTFSFAGSLSVVHALQNKCVSAVTVYNALE